MYGLASTLFMATLCVWLPGWFDVSVVVDRMKRNASISERPSCTTLTHASLSRGMYPSVLWICDYRLGHLTHKVVSEMIYNVSSRVLNPTIPIPISWHPSTVVDGLCYCACVAEFMHLLIDSLVGWLTCWLVDRLADCVAGARSGRYQSRKFSAKLYVISLLGQLTRTTNSSRHRKLLVLLMYFISIF